MKNIQFDEKLFFIWNSYEKKLFHSNFQKTSHKYLNLPDLFELSLIIETKNPPQTLSCAHTTFKGAHKPLAHECKKYCKGSSINYVSKNRDCFTPCNPF